jgi:hypothetical protein
MTWKEKAFRIGVTGQFPNQWRSEDMRRKKDDIDDDFENFD